MQKVEPRKKKVLDGSPITLRLDRETSEQLEALGKDFDVPDWIRELIKDGLAKLQAG